MTEELQQAHEALTRGEGFAVLPGVMTPDDAARVRRSILDQLGRAVDERDGVARLSNLLAVDTSFDAYITSPKLLGLAPTGCSARTRGWRHSGPGS